MISYDWQQCYILGKRHNRVYPGQNATQQGYLLIYSVKRTQLIGRRPLSPCRVRKTAGYTLPRLLFSRTVPRFSEMYPDLAGSGTLPSVIFSARITLRSQQRTPKPKSSCSKQVMATGIASLGGRSAPTKEHQNINSFTFLQRGTDCSDKESDQRTLKPNFSW